MKTAFRLFFSVLFIIFCGVVSAQSRGLAVVANATAGTDIKIGRQYAVLIAIDTYQEWNPLRNPVKDAKTIKEILEKRYFIDEFIELYNDDATSAGIRRLFSSLIEKVGPTDSVLIYYAGHGQLDQFNTGFWIPVDGGSDLDAQKYWIPNAQIRNFVTQMKARSVALISDSCFSGDLLNVSRGAAPSIDSAYYKNALRYTARQVLTSGASEAVPDESEFARQFKSILANNTESCLDPLAMYDRLRRGVTGTLPLFGTLPGHETGGSFVLFLRESDNAKSQVTPEIAEKISAGDLTSLDLQVKDERENLVSLQSAYKTSVSKQQSSRNFRNAGFITGGISAVATGVFFFLGNSLMSDYKSASSASDAEALRGQVGLYSALFISSSSLSVLGLGVGGIMIASSPHPETIETQVQASIDKLRVLEQENEAQKAKTGVSK